MMKRTFIVTMAIVAMFAFPAMAQREMRTINDGWKFLKGDAGSEVVAAEYDDSRWERINVPHSWNTEAYVVKDYYKGVGWYRKMFTLPLDWQDKQIVLRFEGASKEARVWVNGLEVGHHVGGYTAAAFDITPYVKWNVANVLAVQVDNSSREIVPISADFTFFGGIYRDVWLTATSKQHFNLTDMASPGVFVRAHTTDGKEGGISVRTELKNAASDAANVELQQLIYAPDGQLVQTFKERRKLKPGELLSVEMNSKPVVEPMLWTPETPNLYKVVTTLVDRNSKAVLDEVEHYAGFRWYSFDADKGFFLNGKPYKLHGVCRHQDQKPIGPALSDEMHRRDFMLMKEMGVNFIRISHYPQDNALIELCDRMGMLVWEEIPIVDVVTESAEYADNCEYNLREMIRQHYNHPSVILWGYMNEILLARGAKAAPTEKVIELAKRLETVLKEEDSYRLSTMAFHGSDVYNECGLSEVTDVVGWNIYQGWYGGSLPGFDKYMADQHKNHPTHPIIVSEYGAGSDRRLHSLQPRIFDFSMEYQHKLLEHYQQEIERQPYLCGGTQWNFIDFSSANRDESMPRINNKGLVYADRTPKDVYYYFKSAWRKDIPVLHIASRDWDRRSEVLAPDAAVLPVKIYTNLPEVELFADGVSLGKIRTDNCTASFDVPFSKKVTFLYAKGVWQGQTVEDAMTVHFTPIPAVLDENTIDGVELAVNVGSNCYYTSAESHLTWLSDREYRPGSWGYVGGKRHDTTSEVVKTLDTPLYQTMLTDLEAYKFDVPAGTYELEMLFTDVFRPREKSIYLLGRDDSSMMTTQGNCFRIEIGGKVLEENFNPGLETDYYQAVKRRYVVHHEGGTMTVSFIPVKGRSFLSGIKLRKL